MIPPTLVVGVGGFGCNVALGVKRRLEGFASLRAHPDTELDAVRRSVQVFAIDIDSGTPVHNQFSPNERATLVPATPDRTIRQRTDFLAEWWPNHLTTVGGYAKGAGGIRAKGRLAYALLAESQQVAPKIVAAVTNLQKVHADFFGAKGIGGATEAYVYLVGSLSGGTGSGILLTLAMHLRKLLDADVKIIGAIPTASVMQLGPGKFMLDNLYANSAAGLRELEWWLTPAEFRPPATIEPFFEVGGDEIPSALTPFDLTYLYMRQNWAGISMSDFNSYVAVVADCIAADIDSPAATDNQSLISNILGHLVTPVSPQNTTVCKPITFASAGTSALVFPVRAISGYLGDQLAMYVLDTYMLQQSDDTAAARSLLTTQGIAPATDNQPSPLHQKLRQRVTDPVSGNELRVSGPPALNFDQATPETVDATVREQRGLFETNSLKRLERIVELNEPTVTQADWAALRAAIIERINATDGHGFAAAADLLAALHDQLTRRIRVVGLALDNDDPQYALGAHQQLGRITDAFAQHLDQLVKSYQDKMPFGRAQRRQEAADQFSSQWWGYFIQVHERIVLLTAEEKMLKALLLLVDQISSRFKAVRADLNEQRRKLERDEIPAHFQRRIDQMAHEDRVLNHRLLVDEVFGEAFRDLLRTQAAHIQSMAASLTAGGGSLRQRLLAGSTGDAVGPSTAATAELDRRSEVAAAISQLRQRGTDVFLPTVDQMSLWEAMEQEFLARVSLSMFDGFIQALGGGNTPRQQMLTQGRQYLGMRVAACRDAAVPQWRLDPALSQIHQRTFKVEFTGQVVYSLTPFGGDSVRSLIAEFSRDLPGLFDANYSAVHENTSRHHLFVSQRAWGAPLLLMDHSEQDMYVQSEAIWKATKSKHVYIDERYVDVLPDDFSLDALARRVNELETKEQIKQVLSLQEATKEAEALALALHFEFMRKLPGFVGQNGVVPLEVTYSATRAIYQQVATNYQDALEWINGNDKVFSGISKLIAGEWDKLRPQDRRKRLEELATWIDTELGLYPFGDVNRGALEAMQQAVAVLQQGLAG